MAQKQSRATSRSHDGAAPKPGIPDPQSLNPPTHPSPNHPITWPSATGAFVNLTNRVTSGMATDPSIIQRAIDGDERAMRSLWSQHAPHIDAVVRRLVGDLEAAEDIAQEVWIQIFRALPSY